MMRKNKTRGDLLKALFCVAATGTLFGSNCGMAEWEALSAGVDAAMDQLDNQDDDISFGDFISSQLD